VVLCSSIQSRRAQKDERGVVSVWRCCVVESKAFRRSEMRSQESQARRFRWALLPFAAKLAGDSTMCGDLTKERI
jgi:hypothetical protein